MGLRSLAFSGLVLDDAGRIAEDIACLGCGYNLRGLLPEGECPECSTAVGRSIRGDLLHCCDPTWVARLASGADWILAGIICSIVLRLSVVVLAAILLGAAGAPGGRNLHFVFSFLVLGPGLVHIVGCWKVTTPDPSRLNREEAATQARGMARYATIAAVALSPAQEIPLGVGTGAQAAISLGAGLVGLVYCSGFLGTGEG